MRKRTVIIAAIALLLMAWLLHCLWCLTAVADANPRWERVKIESRSEIGARS